MALEIRPGLPDDADGIADVHVRTWQHAYRGLMPQDILDSLDVGQRADRWRRILAGADVDGRGSTWVAVEDGAVIGFSTCGAARDEGPPRPRELYALYLAPERHGSGAAGPLIHATVGQDPAYLWVLTGNARAIAFYEKAGFALDGAVKRDDRGVMVLEELRMVR
ncbi:GNAT family N-acetyltransferase [Microbacterium sp. G2-8]|uniref:GNAT family N-acetyltransferase n=1 Tax=Microbacterium sp. G2-8 TaxID=2842454 RepID=UPI001C89E370|nr:GNAT family N-acetyltransferase [Microbacterium sp. G2-8]